LARRALEEGEKRADRTYEIMRQAGKIVAMVLQVLKSHTKPGIRTEEKRLTLETLFKADEVFLSCSPQKIAPIQRIENQVLERVPGPITTKLMGLLREICSGKDARFKDWLFPVR
jgi:hypothetical protein